MNNSNSSNEFSKSLNSTHFSQIIPSTVIELPNGGTKRLRQKENYVDIIKERNNYYTTDIINKKKHNRVKSFQGKLKIKTESSDLNQNNFNYNKIYNYSASPGNVKKNKNINFKSENYELSDSYNNLKISGNKSLNNSNKKNKIPNCYQKSSILKKVIIIP